MFPFQIGDCCCCGCSRLHTNFHSITVSIDPQQRIKFSWKKNSSGINLRLSYIHTNVSCTTCNFSFLFKCVFCVRLEAITLREKKIYFYRRKKKPNQVFDQLTISRIRLQKSFEYFVY